jgi:hypothetical protein
MKQDISNHIQQPIREVVSELEIPGQGSLQVVGT